MKKLSRLLFAGALSLFLGTSTSGMFAAFDGYMGDYAPRFEGEGPMMDGPGGGIYGPYSAGRSDFGFYGNGDGCNPCCEPRNDCCSRFAFGIDYLYWDVNQTGLDVARTTVGTPPSSSGACCGDCSSTCQTETEFFKFKSRSGFRVGVSYQLPCWDDVSLNFIFTYYHPRVNKKFHNEKINSLCPGQEAMIQTTTDIIDIGPNPLSGCNGAVVPGGFLRWNSPDSVVESRIKLKYELYDLVLSKNFGGCDCWTLTPYIGARVLWLREALRNTIEGSYLVTPTSTPGIFAETSYVWKQQIPAAGLTLGVHAQFCLCGSLNVIGHFGASVLGGKSKWHDNYFPFNSMESATHKERAHHGRIVTGWDGSLGLGYDWNFCSCPIRLGVGYEIQDWFNIPERVRYFNKNITTDAINPISTAQTSDGNGRFTVHGLFVRLAFAF